MAEQIIDLHLNEDKVAMLPPQGLNIDNYFFDPIYEAKAYSWITHNIDLKVNKVLLWVVGKRNLEFKTQEIKYRTI